MDNKNWNNRKKEIMKEKTSSSNTDDNHLPKEASKNCSTEINLNRKEDEEFTEYMARIRKYYKHDPRPDLKEDSHLWEIVLDIAERNYTEAYRILHGFRCGGARLKQGAHTIKMEARIGSDHLWQSKKEYMADRKRWLIPKRKILSEIFFLANNNLGG